MKFCCTHPNKLDELISSCQGNEMDDTTKVFGGKSVLHAAKLARIAEMQCNKCRLRKLFRKNKALYTSALIWKAFHHRLKRAESALLSSNTYFLKRLLLIPAKIDAKTRESRTDLGYKAASRKDNS